jgi:hypothetical protein
MRLRASLVAFAGVAAVAALALAQAETAEAPLPKPEVEKLGYFVGAWTMEGELKESALGPGGKLDGRDMCRWMPGKFFVTCRLEHKGPTGAVMALGVLGYDPDKKVYTSASYNNLGMAETATGAFENGTWTWSSDRILAGKPVKSRIVMSDTTPSGYKVRWETSDTGKTWRTRMTGNVTKLQAKSKEAEKKEER